MISADDLVVVIPTRNRWDILRRTLEGLDAQTVQGFEVVVVVDGRDQVVPDDVAAGPDRRLIIVDRGGPGRARNRGVEAVDRPLVLFLGDDMVPVPELVASHLRVHETRPDETVTSLGHVDWHPDVADDRILRWLDWSGTQFDYRHLAGQAGQDVGFGRFYSCNISLKRALLARVGGFDEDFIYFYEDLDLGYRLGEAGMELIYEPAALAHHLQTYDLDDVRRRFEGIALGERLMADRHAWFRPPYFHARVVRAANRRPARRIWTSIVDLLPVWAPLRRHAEVEADAWYLQQIAAPFLAAWERAGAVVELRRYLGERFDAAALIHHAVAVERESSDTSELDFYRTSEAYLYDLTAFSMSGTKDPYHEELRRHVPPGGRLLDYGCGIGADGLRLLGAGYTVEFADFDNPSTRYLRWRLDERGIEAPVYDIERDDIPDGFDAAYAFDVIEHVDDPFRFLAELERRAAIVVVNLLEDDPHDHEHHLHRELPIAELTAHARERGLLSHTVHHGRSHLLVYCGDGSNAGGRSGRSPGASTSSPAR